MASRGEDKGKTNYQLTIPQHITSIPIYTLGRLNLASRMLLGTSQRICFAD